MSVYGAVYSDIWHDRKFRELDEKGQKLFLYLLSSPHKTMIGYYHLPLHYAIYDLNWDEETFNDSMKRLEEKGMAFYDDETEIIFMKNFFRYNPVKSGTSVKGLFNQLNKAKDSKYFGQLIRTFPQALANDSKKEVKDLFWSQYRPFERSLKNRDGQELQDGNIPPLYPIEGACMGHARGIDTPCISVSVTESVTETETETETESVTESVTGDSLSLDEEKEGKAPPASRNRKSFFNCLEDQRQDQTREPGTQDKQAFRIELSRSLFPKNLYNSDVGEVAMGLLNVLGDPLRTLSVIDECSVGARSPDDLAQRLWNECKGHAREAVL